jgi:hypothetical protein
VVYGSQGIEMCKTTERGWGESVVTKFNHKTYPILRSTNDSNFYKYKNEMQIIESNKNKTDTEFTRKTQLGKNHGEDYLTI